MAVANDGMTRPSSFATTSASWRAGYTVCMGQPALSKHHQRHLQQPCQDNWHLARAQAFGLSNCYQVVIRPDDPKFHGCHATDDQVIGLQYGLSYR